MKTKEQSKQVRYTVVENHKAHKSQKLLGIVLQSQSTGSVSEFNLTFSIVQCSASNTNS